MARAEYTWTEIELYNKGGIQIFIVRANENNRARCYQIVENGVKRKVTREEVNPYLDPDYEKRQVRKAKRKEAMRASYEKYPWTGEDLYYKPL